MVALIKPYRDLSTMLLTTKSQCHILSKMVMGSVWKTAHIFGKRTTHLVEKGDGHLGVCADDGTQLV